MRASNSHRRILNIVRRIHPYNSSQERPRPKRATTQRSNMFRRCRRRIDGRRVVHARRECEGAVCLNRVADGDDRGLYAVVALVRGAFEVAGRGSAATYEKEPFGQEARCGGEEEGHGWPIVCGCV